MQLPQECDARRDCTFTVSCPHNVPEHPHHGWRLSNHALACKTSIACTTAFSVPNHSPTCLASIHQDCILCNPLHNSSGPVGYDMLAWQAALPSGSQGKASPLQPEVGVHAPIRQSTSRSGLAGMQSAARCLPSWLEGMGLRAKTLRAQDAAYATKSRGGAQRCRCGHLAAGWHGCLFFNEPADQLSPGEPGVPCINPFCDTSFPLRCQVCLAMCP